MERVSRFPYLLRFDNREFSTLQQLTSHLQGISNHEEHFQAYVTVIRQAYRTVRSNEEAFDKLLQHVEKDIIAYKSAGYSYLEFRTLFCDELTFVRTYRRERNRQQESRNAIENNRRDQKEGLNWFHNLPVYLRDSKSFLDALKAFSRYIWTWEEARCRINYQIVARLRNRKRGVRLDKGVTTSDIKTARQQVVSTQGRRDVTIKQRGVLPLDKVDQEWLKRTGLTLNRFSIITAAHEIPRISLPEV
ncbi:hypothetical protein F4677DRAFT_434375 [Hypoxylon crocopeplum]|nr:hypothetical protein F4677DRAFT_434375 [Hypoxylon crocopeplum]